MKPGLELKGWVYVLEVEVMGGEANHVTNRVRHMAAMHVRVVRLMVFIGGDINTNELRARF